MRRSSRVGLRLVFLAVIWLFGNSGCATGGFSRPGMTDPFKRKTSINIETRPSGARVMVNGEEQGEAPLMVRVDIDDNGMIAYDTEISAEWEGSGNPSTYTLAAGTMPPVEGIRLGTNGIRLQ